MHLLVLFSLNFILCLTQMSDCIVRTHTVLSISSKNLFKNFSSSMYASFTVTSDGVADVIQLSRLATKRIQLISLSQSCTSAALALMQPHKKNQASSDKEKVCGRQLDSMENLHVCKTVVQPVKTWCEKVGNGAIMLRLHTLMNIMGHILH